MSNTAFWKRWMPLFLMVVFLIIIYKLLDNTAQVVSFVRSFISIISPFLLGILICYILYKPCFYVEKVIAKIKPKFIAKKARVISVLTVYFLVITLMSLFIVFIVPIIINNLIDLASDIPAYYSNILTFIYNLQADIDFIDWNIDLGFTDFAINTLSQFFDASRIEQLARNILGLANGIFRTVISLFVSMYALIDRKRLVAFFNSLIAAMFAEKTRKETTRYIGKSIR